MSYDEITGVVLSYDNSTDAFWSYDEISVLSVLDEFAEISCLGEFWPCCIEGDLAIFPVVLMGS